MRPLRYGPSNYAISHRPQVLTNERQAAAASTVDADQVERCGLHLIRIRAALTAACLVSSPVLSVCRTGRVQSTLRSFTSHELFPAQAAGGRRVSARASCRDLSVAGFGLLILNPLLLHPAS
jgi:hypothetical protein